MLSFRIRPLTTTAIAVLLVLPGVAEAAQPRAFRAVERGLERLVATPGGPPGAIATIHRGGRTTVLSAGRSNVRRRGAPRAREHMRIASVSKAFSGAVALNLVGKGTLGLDDTIGQRLPSLPVAWHPVTLRQMLNHTSGLPDYSASEGFSTQLRTDPGGYVSPSRIVEWVSANGLVFPPGSRYTYSNTENIIVALMAEAATGERYGRLLRSVVFRPARLTETSLPTRRTALPRPFIHGYLTEPGEEPEDATTLISPSGAWASGGIVSTPRDVGAFMRAYLRGRFFGAEQKRAQRRFVPGASVPPGPGTNSSGLALFRYRTRCGTVYGHTGDFPGYAQWAAATANGRRSVTTSLNMPAPEGALLDRLRRVQATAVCALLRN
jgi:D-alanyl-D-alanine carboxypeptidase